MLTDITLRDTTLIMTYEINSIDELIRELGGPSAVGAWLGISQAAVSNWTARQSIPPGWHWRLAAAARKRGKTVAPAVFDLDDDEAVLLNIAVA